MIKSKNVRRFWVALSLIVISTCGCLYVIKPAEAFAPWNWWYETIPGVPVGMIGNTHRVITENAIKRIQQDTYGFRAKSMDKAIDQIAVANGRTDNVQTVSELHFDGESFPEGQRRLQRLVQQIKQELSLTSVAEPTKAREVLGQALHTLQDYYSHSSWVETYGAIPNKDLGVAGVPFQRLPETTATCDDFWLCDCLFGPDCKNLLQTPLVTSGYYSSSKGNQDRVKKPGKCSHGSPGDTSAVGLTGKGINKDTASCVISPHWQLHPYAAYAAENSTYEFITKVVKPELTPKQYNALLGYSPELAIVIDTTESMASKIASVKQKAIQLVNSRIGTRDEPFLYVLIAFNDPGRSAYVTWDRNEFIQAINSLSAGGGGDCPEPSIRSVIVGLQKMTNFGDLFLYTDGTRNDSDVDVGIAERIAESMNIKVHRFILGSCSPLDPAYIALNRTGGQLFYLPGTDAGNVTDFIDHVVRQDVVDVVSIEDTLGNNTKNYPVAVDPTLRSMTIAISSIGGLGAISNFAVYRPDGSRVLAGDTDVNWTPLGVGALIKVTSPSVGSWNVSITANSTIYLRVYGESSLDLTSFNFVELQGHPGGHQGYGPSNSLPYIGQTTKAVATVSSDSLGTPQFEMRTRSGNVFQTLNFPEIQRGVGIFREFGGEITIPTTPFFIYMVGTDSSGNQYQRVWAPVVKPQPLQITAPQGLELVRGQTTLFKFKVKAFTFYGYDLYTFGATDSKGYYYSVAPSTKILSPGVDDTVEVTVEIRTPANAVVGSVDTIAFVAHGSVEGNNSNVNGVVIDAEVVENLLDTIPPAVDCSPNISATASGGQNYAIVNYLLPAIQDNRNGATVSCLPQTGSSFPVGTTTVNCTATDAAGNSNICSFTINVAQNGDTSPPIMTCPANVVTNIPYGQSNGAVFYSPPNVADDRAGVTTSCSPASGSTFSRGITTVSCLATDAAGNQANCSFIVTIYDVSLQDDASGDTLLFNSITGDYTFYRCGSSGFTLSGRGTITRQGCLVKLGGDPKVSATLDSCPIAPANKGSATIKPNPIGGWIYITDSNTTNNTRPCPNG